MLIECFPRREIIRYEKAFMFVVFKWTMIRNPKYSFQCWELWGKIFIFLSELRMQIRIAWFEISYGQKALGQKSWDQFFLRISLQILDFYLHVNIWIQKTWQGHLPGRDQTKPNQTTRSNSASTALGQMHIDGLRANAKVACCCGC